MAVKHARIAVLSCTHAPFTPPETVGWVLDTISNLKDLTHIVHLGDVFEASAASVHPNEATHTLFDEYEHAAGFLDSLREAVPQRCAKVVCMGNHDDNLQAADPRRVPAQLRAAVSFLESGSYGSSFRRWSWLPYRKGPECVFRVGQVLLFHGFDAGVNSDELEGLQVANLMGGHSHVLTVRGHTHRPLPPTQARRTSRIPLPFWHMNVGTCGPLNPSWMSRKDTSQWGAGLAIIEAARDPDRSVPSPQWSAELLRPPSRRKWS